MPWTEPVTLYEEAGVDSSGDSGELKGFAPFSTGTFTCSATAAATDTQDTLDVYIQRKLPNGDWEDLVHFTQCVGDATVPFNMGVADVFAGASGGIFEGSPDDAALAAGNVQDKPWANTLRVKWVIIDTTNPGDAAFSFSVKAQFRV